MLSFKVSPVVQEVVQKKNKELAKDCELLISNMIDLLVYEPGSCNLINVSYADAAIYARYAETTIGVINKSLNLPILCERVGSYYNTTGDLTKALYYFEEYSQLRKVLYEDNPQNVSFKNGLVISYEYLGNNYTTLGDFEKALYYYEE